jgi:hypothetical protein
MPAGIDVTTSGDDAASDDLGAGRRRRRMSAARPPEGPHQGKEARMRSNDAEAPRGIIRGHLTKWTLKYANENHPVPGKRLR